jgi:hypothetical protein
MGYNTYLIVKIVIYTTKWSFTYHLSSEISVLETSLFRLSDEKGKYRKLSSK